MLVFVQAGLVVNVVARSSRGNDDSGGSGCAGASRHHAEAAAGAHPAGGNASAAWVAGISAAAEALCQSPASDPAAIDGWGARGDAGLDDAWDAALRHAGLAGPGSYHVLVTRQRQQRRGRAAAMPDSDDGAVERGPARSELLVGRRRGAFLRLADDGISQRMLGTFFYGCGNRQPFVCM